MLCFWYIIIVVFVDKVYLEDCGWSTAGLETDFPTHKNITRLKLANSNLLIIKRKTFKRYNKLEELSIINSGVVFIEDGAFYDLPCLSQVNISGNFIFRLSSKIFRPHSKLWKLVVSHNMLSDIDAFDVSLFPQLAVFDISNNHISSLPSGVIGRVKRDRNFSLITSGNPLNSSNGVWSDVVESVDDIQPQMLRSPPRAGFRICIFWIVGALWVGIIIGNVCLIRKILFCSKNIKKDESTQYEFVHKHSDTFRPSRQSSALAESRMSTVMFKTPHSNSPSDVQMFI